MGLKQAIEKIEAKLSDWSELEVYTFTGDVKNVVQADSKIDWDTLGQKATQGTIQLVAATRISADFDAQQFQANVDLPNMADLVKAHANAVDSSLAGRKAIFDFFAQSISKIVKL